MNPIIVAKLINVQAIIFVIIFLLDQTLKERGQKKRTNKWCSCCFYNYCEWSSDKNVFCEKNINTITYTTTYNTSWLIPPYSFPEPVYILFYLLYTFFSGNL